MLGGCNIFSNTFCYQHQYSQSVVPFKNCVFVYGEGKLTEKVAFSRSINIFFLKPRKIFEDNKPVEEFL